MKHNLFITRRNIMFTATILPLAGCATAGVILTDVGEATGVLDINGAVSLYGIAKGIAEIASLAVPGLGPIVSAAIAIGDVLIANPTSVNTTKIVAQAHTLLLVSAPAVHVVAN